MADDAGKLHVFTNPAMPGMVKIGFTTNSIEQRRKELSRASGVPLPFECHFAAEVSSMKKKEEILHQIFEKERVNDGREFFRIDPERAVLAIKMGRYKDLTPPKPNVGPGEKKALEKAKKIEEQKLAKFTFDSVGIPVGPLLRFTRDENDVATVEPGNEVKYGGQILSISGAAKLALKKVGKDWSAVQRSLYWMYNGRTLSEIREAAGV